MRAASVTRSNQGQFLLLLLILGWSSAGVVAQLKLPVTSRSRHFIVHDARAPFSPSRLSTPKSVENLIRLAPDVLLISAERIREEVVTELKFSARAAPTARIHLYVRTAAGEDEDPTLVSIFFTDGWQYRLAIPDRISELKLTRAIVQALLLEVANQGAGPKSAEIPLWLTEGLSRNLLAAAGPPLVLGAAPPGQMAQIVRHLHGADPLREAREFLRSHPPLSFSDLCHPTPAQMTGENLKLYQHSAQLFVHELTRLPNGRAGLVTMLREAPYFWNWETAFLRAFHPTFQRLLDVEKWWSVNLIAGTGRDERRAWSPAAALQRLDQLLLPWAEVRVATDTLPLRVQVAPQEIVAEWPFDQQKPVLGQMINQLTLMRYHAPRELVPLIDRYRVCLHNYLQRRGQAGYAPATRKEVMIHPSQVIQEAIRQLDELLRQREALHRAQSASAQAAVAP